MCPCLLSGNKKMIIITKIEGEKIIGNLIKTSEKEKNLFLLIKITAEKGANSIICSHIKHKIGKKIKIIEFKIAGLNSFPEKKKRRNKKQKY